MQGADRCSARERTSCRLAGPAQSRRLQIVHNPAAAALQPRTLGRALPNMRAWKQPAAEGVYPSRCRKILKHTSPHCAALCRPLPHPRPLNPLLRALRPDRHHNMLLDRGDPAAPSHPAAVRVRRCPNPKNPDFTRLPTQKQPKHRVAPHQARTVECATAVPPPFSQSGPAG